MLRDDAVAIWKAGVAAVDSERLVRESIARTADRLTIAGHDIPLTGLGRIAVVGAGKAGAGMAAGFESAVGAELLRDRVTGWINVPADCVRPLKKLHLHAARPAGLNEPTAEGVAGSLRILEIVRGLTPRDVCVVLLSGGGSALLPAPAAGISLEDKQHVTRLLMHSGATIHELNGVRKQLSQIKGGRLAAACGAGRIITLIISDVIGDPLDVIASGPTVADPMTPRDALAILRRFVRGDDEIPRSVVAFLESAASASGPLTMPAVHNHVIGNNAVALNAAASEAQRRGYVVRSLGSANQGEAREAGRLLAEACREERDGRKAGSPPLCVLSGGEPVVKLAATSKPRKGGRNQELALAALAAFWNDPRGMTGLAILSGGTDGEDGPTDAAGAVADQDVLETARSRRLDPAPFLEINDSYRFFDEVGGLLKTGPTDTNVMDLRVALIGPG